MASISLKYKSKSGNLTAPGDVDLGAMIPIETITVGSGGSSSITFSSIPQVYEHLQVRGIGSLSGDNESRIRFNSDTGSNYSWHQLLSNYAGSGSVSSSAGTSVTFIKGAVSYDQQSPFIFDILDYTNTNKYKTVRTLSGTNQNSTGTNSYVRFSSGLWLNTNAITGITIFPASGNFAQYSSLALYGIKRAGA
jgi:hypothetical protein